MKKNIQYIIWDNIKTIFIALIIAVIIRSFLFQPFYIPSSSMEPTLLIGDRIFVSKYTYGYSNHSLPFSPPIMNKRVLKKTPQRGDLVVFKTPADNRTDYIKRLIGLPGDTIQFIEGEILLNKKPIIRKRVNFIQEVRCGSSDLKVDAYEEKLNNGVTYIAVYNKNGTLKNTDLFTVPENHYFFLGDNRDCSKDSRFLSSVGYVKNLNLVGKAQIIFFSNDTVKSKFIKFWNWNESFRFKRFFMLL
ncbi:MAG: signal peptidase I [Pelagibacteraceae bacterium TMED287]|nr:MAG: signal peptidase I [Pelagibacteraceae bacterium TMED287]|tara:strand:+ start:1696 stop:2433 length:738 start_codon:yes stop_codon:yes gene_type:complete